MTEGRVHHRRAGYPCCDVEHLDERLDGRIDRTASTSSYTLCTISVARRGPGGYTAPLVPVQNQRGRLSCTLFCRTRIPLTPAPSCNALYPNAPAMQAHYNPPGSLSTVGPRRPHTTPPISSTIPYPSLSLTPEDPVVENGSHSPK